MSQIPTTDAATLNTENDGTESVVKNSRFQELSETLTAELDGMDYLVEKLQDYLRPGHTWDPSSLRALIHKTKELSRAAIIALYAQEEVITAAVGRGNDRPGQDLTPAALSQGESITPVDMPHVVKVPGGDKLPSQ